MAKKIFNIVRYLVIYLVITVLLLEISLQALHIFFKPENRAAKPLLANAVRIVTLGDSNTYGIYLAETLTYPGQLQSKLDEQLKLTAEVINLGYPGSNSETIARNLETTISAFKPDILVIMLGVNDYWAQADIISADNSNPEKNTVAFWKKSRVIRLIQLAIRNEFVSNDLIQKERVVIDPRTLDQEALQKHLAKAIANKNPEKSYIEYNGYKLDVTRTKPSKEKRKHSPAESIEGNLSYIAETAKQHEIAVYLMTYPSGQSIYGDANKELRKFAENYSLPLVDNEPLVYLNCVQSDNCDIYFYPDQHATEQGNDLVSKNLAERLIRDLQ